MRVQEQYEAVGHAVRAVYTYSGMADVAVETHDVDYQSAVKSLWDNIVHKKYYLTGGVGSGETSEGFGPDYSLRNNAYCEACSSCGEVFFQWKLHLAYHDAQVRRPVRADALQRPLRVASISRARPSTTPIRSTPTSSERRGTTVRAASATSPRTMLMLPTWTYSKSAGRRST